MNSIFRKKSNVSDELAAHAEGIGGPDLEGDRITKEKGRNGKNSQRSRKSEFLQAHLDTYRFFIRNKDDPEAYPKEDDLKYICGDTDNKSLAKDTYYGTPSEAGDENSLPPAKSESSLGDFIGAYAEFILFLQYLGVILGNERVDLGVWEAVVGWLAFILGELDFSSISITYPATSIIVAIAAFPLINVALLIYFTKAKYRILAGYVPAKGKSIIYDDHYAEQSALKDDFRLMYFVGFLFAGLLISSITLLLKENAAGFFVIIASGYVFILLVFLIGRKVVFSTISVRFFLRSLLVFSYVPLDSFLATTIVIFSVPQSEEEEIFGLVGVIVMTILMIYLVFFEIQYILYPSTFAISVAAHEELIDEHVLMIDQVDDTIHEAKLKTYSGKFQILLSKLPIFYNEKQQQFLERENRSEVDPKRYYIGIVFFFERLMMALCGGVFGSENFQEQSVLLSGMSEKHRENLEYYGFTTILVFTCLSLYIVKPYAYIESDEEHKLVAMQFVPRVAHILLLVVILQREYLGELVLQLTLFCAISFPTMYFWYWVLEPGKIFGLLKRKLSDLREDITARYNRHVWDNLMDEDKFDDDDAVLGALNLAKLNNKIWRPLPLGLKLKVNHVLSKDNNWNDLYKQHRLDGSLYKKAIIHNASSTRKASVTLTNIDYSTSNRYDAPPIPLQHFRDETELRFRKEKANTDNSTNVYEQLSQPEYWFHWETVKSLIIADSLNLKNAEPFGEFLERLENREIGKQMDILGLPMMRLTKAHNDSLLSFIEATTLNELRLGDWSLQESDMNPMNILWGFLLRLLLNKELPKMFSSFEEQDISFSLKKKLKGESGRIGTELRKLNMHNMITESTSLEEFNNSLSKINVTRFHLEVYATNEKPLDLAVSQIYLSLLANENSSYFEVKFHTMGRMDENSMYIEADKDKTKLTLKNIHFLKQCSLQGNEESFEKRVRKLEITNVQLSDYRIFTVAMVITKATLVNCQIVSDSFDRSAQSILNEVITRGCGDYANKLVTSNGNKSIVVKSISMTYSQNKYLLNLVNIEIFFPDQIKRFGECLGWIEPTSVIVSYENNSASMNIEALDKHIEEIFRAISLKTNTETFTLSFKVQKTIKKNIYIGEEQVNLDNITIGDGEYGFKNPLFRNVSQMILKDLVIFKLDTLSLMILSCNKEEDECFTKRIYIDSLDMTNCVVQDTKNFDEYSIEICKIVLQEYIGTFNGSFKEQRITFNENEFIIENIFIFEDKNESFSTCLATLVERFNNQQCFFKFSKVSLNENLFQNLLNCLNKLILTEVHITEFRFLADDNGSDPIEEKFFIEILLLGLTKQLEYIQRIVCSAKSSAKCLDFTKSNESIKIDTQFSIFQHKFDALKEILQRTHLSTITIDCDFSEIAFMSSYASELTETILGNKGIKYFKLNALKGERPLKVSLEDEIIELDGINYNCIKSKGRVRKSFHCLFQKLATSEYYQKLVWKLNQATISLQDINFYVIQHFQHLKISKLYFHEVIIVDSLEEKGKLNIFYAELFKRMLKNKNISEFEISSSKSGNFISINRSTDRLELKLSCVDFLKALEDLMPSFRDKLDAEIGYVNEFKPKNTMRAFSPKESRLDVCCSNYSKALQEYKSSCIKDLEVGKSFESKLQELEDVKSLYVEQLEEPWRNMKNSERLKEFKSSLAQIIDIENALINNLKALEVLKSSFTEDISRFPSDVILEPGPNVKTLNGVFTELFVLGVENENIKRFNVYGANEKEEFINFDRTNWILNVSCYKFTNTCVEKLSNFVMTSPPSTVHVNDYANTRELSYLICSLFAASLETSVTEFSSKMIQDSDIACYFHNENDEQECNITLGDITISQDYLNICRASLEKSTYVAVKLKTHQVSSVQIDSVFLALCLGCIPNKITFIRCTATFPSNIQKRIDLSDRELVLTKLTFTSDLQHNLTKTIAEHHSNFDGLRIENSEFSFNDFEECFMFVEHVHLSKLQLKNCKMMQSRKESSISFSEILLLALSNTKMRVFELELVDLVSINLNRLNDQMTVSGSGSVSFRNNYPKLQSIFQKERCSHVTFKIDEHRDNQRFKNGRQQRQQLDHQRFRNGRQQRQQLDNQRFRNGRQQRQQLDNRFISAIFYGCLSNPNLQSINISSNNNSSVTLNEEELALSNVKLVDIPQVKKLNDKPFVVQRLDFNNIFAPNNTTFSELISLWPLQDLKLENCQVHECTFDELSVELSTLAVERRIGSFSFRNTKSEAITQEISLYDHQFSILDMKLSETGPTKFFNSMLNSLSDKKPAILIVDIERSKFSFSIADSFQTFLRSFKLQTVIFAENTVDANKNTPVDSIFFYNILNSLLCNPKIESISCVGPGGHKQLKLQLEQHVYTIATNIPIQDQSLISMLTVLKVSDLQRIVFVWKGSLKHSLSDYCYAIYLAALENRGIASFKLQKSKREDSYFQFGTDMILDANHFKLRLPQEATHRDAMQVSLSTSYRSRSKAGDFKSLVIKFSNAFVCDQVLEDIKKALDDNYISSLTLTNLYPIVVPSMQGNFLTLYFWDFLTRGMEKDRLSNLNCSGGKDKDRINPRAIISKADDNVDIKTNIVSKPIKVRLLDKAFKFIEAPSVNFTWTASVDNTNFMNNNCYSMCLAALKNKKLSTFIFSDVTSKQPLVAFKENKQLSIRNVELRFPINKSYNIDSLATVWLNRTEKSSLVDLDIDLSNVSVSSQVLNNLYELLQKCKVSAMKLTDLDIVQKEEANNLHKFFWMFLIYGIQKHTLIDLKCSSLFHTPDTNHSIALNRMEKNKLVVQTNTQFENDQFDTLVGVLRVFKTPELEFTFSECKRKFIDNFLYRLCLATLTNQAVFSFKFSNSVKGSPLIYFSKNNGIEIRDINLNIIDDSFSLLNNLSIEDTEKNNQTVIIKLINVTATHMALEDLENVLTKGQVSDFTLILDGIVEDKNNRTEKSVDEYFWSFLASSVESSSLTNLSCTSIFNAKKMTFIKGKEQCTIQTNSRLENPKFLTFLKCFDPLKTASLTFTWTGHDKIFADSFFYPIALALLENSMISFFELNCQLFKDLCVKLVEIDGNKHFEVANLKMQFFNGYNNQVSFTQCRFCREGNNLTTIKFSNVATAQECLKDIGDAMNTIKVSSFHLTDVRMLVPAEFQILNGLFWNYLLDSLKNPCLFNLFCRSTESNNSKAPLVSLLLSKTNGEYGIDTNVPMDKSKLTRLLGAMKKVKSTRLNLQWTGNRMSFAKNYFYPLSLALFNNSNVNDFKLFCKLFDQSFIEQKQINQERHFKASNVNISLLDRSLNQNFYAVNSLKKGLMKKDKLESTSIDLSNTQVSREFLDDLYAAFETKKITSINLMGLGILNGRPNQRYKKKTEIAEYFWKYLSRALKYPTIQTLHLATNEGDKLYFERSGMPIIQFSGIFYNEGAFSGLSKSFQSCQIDDLSVVALEGYKYSELDPIFNTLVFMSLGHNVSITCSSSEYKEKRFTSKCEENNKCILHISNIVVDDNNILEFSKFLRTAEYRCVEIIIRSNEQKPDYEISAKKLFASIIDPVLARNKLSLLECIYNGIEYCSYSFDNVKEKFSLGIKGIKLTEANIHSCKEIIKGMDIACFDIGVDSHFVDESSLIEIASGALENSKIRSFKIEDDTTQKKIELSAHSLVIDKINFADMQNGKDIAQQLQNSLLKPKQKLEAIDLTSLNMDVSQFDVLLKCAERPDLKQLHFKECSLSFNTDVMSKGSVKKSHITLEWRISEELKIKVPNLDILHSCSLLYEQLKTGLFDQCFLEYIKNTRYTNEVVIKTLKNIISRKTKISQFLIRQNNNIMVSLNDTELQLQNLVYSEAETEKILEALCVIEAAYISSLEFNSGSFLRCPKIYGFISESKLTNITLRNCEIPNVNDSVMKLFKIIKVVVARSLLQKFSFLVGSVDIGICREEEIDRRNKSLKYLKLSLASLQLDQNTIENIFSSLATQNLDKIYFHERNLKENIITTNRVSTDMYSTFLLKTTFKNYQSIKYFGYECFDTNSDFEYIFDSGKIDLNINDICIKLSKDSLIDVLQQIKDPVFESKINFSDKNGNSGRYRIVSSWMLQSVLSCSKMKSFNISSERQISINFNYKDNKMELTGLPLSINGVFILLNKNYKTLDSLNTSPSNFERGGNQQIYLMLQNTSMKSIVFNTILYRRKDNPLKQLTECLVASMRNQKLRFEGNIEPSNAKAIKDNIDGSTCTVKCINFLPNFKEHHVLSVFEARKTKLPNESKPPNSFKYHLHLSERQIPKSKQQLDSKLLYLWKHLHSMGTLQEYVLEVECGDSIKEISYGKKTQDKPTRNQVKLHNITMFDSQLSSAPRLELSFHQCKFQSSLKDYSYYAKSITPFTRIEFHDISHFELNIRLLPVLNLYLYGCKLSEEQIGNCFRNKLVNRLYFKNNDLLYLPEQIHCLERENDVGEKNLIIEEPGLPPEVAVNFLMGLFINQNEQYKTKSLKYKHENIRFKSITLPWDYICQDNQLINTVAYLSYCTSDIFETSNYPFKSLLLYPDKTVNKRALQEHIKSGCVWVLPHAFPALKDLRQHLTKMHTESDILSYILQPKPLMKEFIYWLQHVCKISLKEYKYEVNALGVKLKGERGYKRFRRVDTGEHDSTSDPDEETNDEDVSTLEQNNESDLDEESDDDDISTKDGTQNNQLDTDIVNAKEDDISSKVRRQNNQLDTDIVSAKEGNISTKDGTQNHQLNTDIVNAKEDDISTKDGTQNNQLDTDIVNAKEDDISSKVRRQTNQLDTDIVSAKEDDVSTLEQNNEYDSDEETNDEDFSTQVNGTQNNQLDTDIVSAKEEDISTKDRIQNNQLDTDIVSAKEEDISTKDRIQNNQLDTDIVSAKEDISTQHNSEQNTDNRFDGVNDDHYASIRRSRKLGRLDSDEAGGDERDSTRQNTNKDN